MDIAERLNAALPSHYRVERELGSGGMAAVYLAHDVKHERDVAIKVLHPDLAAALGAERFLSEIKTTAKLQHPHILALLDSGVADGLLYYVMPYVPGETLRMRLVRERQLPINDALRIAREVADALGAAHAMGIIHRDVKPENILLQGDHALVADFGIALAVHQAGGARMTQTGLSLGTPQYMSPEQAMGEKTIDARADIYGVGAVLYEMLTGEPPFTGPSVQAIVARLMSDEPRGIVAQRKAVPDHVEQAVLRALEKLPADRFDSAPEFADALSQPVAGIAGTRAGTDRTGSLRDVGARRPHPRLRSAAPLAVALLAGVMLSGMVAWTVARYRGEPRSLSFVIEPPERAGVREPTSHLEISPDGGTVGFLVESDAAPQLYVRSLDDVDGHFLAIPGGTGTYAFSPDGRRIAAAGSDGKLRIMTLAGGNAVTVAAIPRSWSGVAWANGTTLVLGGQPNGAGLWEVSTTGTGLHQVFKPRATFIQGYPSVADDGETVAFLDWGPGFTEDDYLAIGSLKTGQFETSKLLAQGIARIADGRVLYTTAGGSIMSVRFDRRSHKVIGEAERVMDGLTNINTPTAFLSASGTLVYARGQPTDRLMVADSTGMHALSTEDRTLVAQPFSGSVRYSPDGRRIALNITEQRTDTTVTNVWTFDVATQTFSQVTTTGDVSSPEWTPDGRRLVFTNWFGARPGIWTQAADGSDSARAIVQLPAGQNALGVSVTPDGRGIVYCTSYIGAVIANSVYYAPLTAGGGVPEKLFTTDQGDAFNCGARVSPDGRWLTYAQITGDQPQVFVRPFRSAGPRVQVSTDIGDSPVWSRSGDRLYYRSASGSITVATLHTEGGAVSVASRQRVPGTSGVTIYDVAPDGRILMPLANDSHKQIVVTTHWTSPLRAGSAPER